MPLEEPNTRTTADQQTIRTERRRLTRPEAERLHQELKTTANILGYSVGELLHFTNVLVAIVEKDSGEENFAGVCISKDLLFGWTDIAVLYILPEFRKRGIGALLFRAAFAAAEARERHIFTLSRSPEVIRLMERLGMQVSRDGWKAPLAVHLDSQVHMMSLYRWYEVFRKMPIRNADGCRFRTGEKRWSSTVHGVEEDATT